MCFVWIFELWALKHANYLVITVMDLVVIRRDLFSVRSVLWCCWLGGRKGIRPVKKQSGGGAGMVICLKRGADLHMAQLMPLSLTVSCFSKVQIGFTFLLLTHLGSPGKRAVERVCIKCAKIRWLYKSLCVCGLTDWNSKATECNLCTDHSVSVHRGDAPVSVSY